MYLMETNRSADQAVKKARESPVDVCFASPPFWRHSEMRFHSAAGRHCFSESRFGAKARNPISAIKEVVGEHSKS
jgi:hypothetical protein